jgi:hypothetical protein
MARVTTVADLRCPWRCRSRCAVQLVPRFPSDGSYPVRPYGLCFVTAYCRGAWMQPCTTYCIARSLEPHRLAHSEHIRVTVYSCTLVSTPRVYGGWIGDPISGGHAPCSSQAISRTDATPRPPPPDATRAQHHTATRVTPSHSLRAATARRSPLGLAPTANAPPLHGAFSLVG